MTRTFTCILCPNGCEITVQHENGEISSCEGNQCKNGIKYVTQELQDPRRTIASSVAVTGGDFPLVSVRLTSPVPRAEIFSVMEQIRSLSLTAPVEPGTVLVHNILGTDSDLITTSRVKKA